MWAKYSLNFSKWKSQIFLGISSTQIQHYKNLHCYVSGFDVGDISEESSDDLEGLDAAASHVANLLSTEPADSMFLP